MLSWAGFHQAPHAGPGEQGLCSRPAVGEVGAWPSIDGMAHRTHQEGECRVASLSVACAVHVLGSGAAMSELIGPQGRWCPNGHYTSSAAMFCGQCGAAFNAAAPAQDLLRTANEADDSPGSGIDSMHGTHPGGSHAAVSGPAPAMARNTPGGRVDGILVLLGCLLVLAGGALAAGVVRSGANTGAATPGLATIPVAMPTYPVGPEACSGRVFAATSVGMSNARQQGPSAELAAVLSASDLALAGLPTLPTETEYVTIRAAMRNYLSRIIDEGATPLSKASTAGVYLDCGEPLPW